jgi:hypothetical protein
MLLTSNALNNDYARDADPALDLGMGAAQARAAFAKAAFAKAAFAKAAFAKANWAIVGGPLARLWARITMSREDALFERFAGQRWCDSVERNLDAAIRRGRY